MAVKVTEPPLHIEVVLAAITTEGVTEVAVMVTGLLVAVVGLAQGSLLFTTTVTISALANVELVKVDAVCPATFTPFIFHS